MPSGPSLTGRTAKMYFFAPPKGAQWSFAPSPSTPDHESTLSTEDLRDGQSCSHQTYCIVWVNNSTLNNSARAAHKPCTSRTSRRISPAKGTVMPYNRVLSESLPSFLEAPSPRTFFPGGVPLHKRGAPGGRSLSEGMAGSPRVGPVRVAADVPRPASAPHACPGSVHGQDPLGYHGCSVESGLKRRDAGPEARPEPAQSEVQRLTGRQHCT